MSFELQQAVEICMKEEGFLGSYYPATILCVMPTTVALAAIEPTKYLVRYKTRYNEENTRLLNEVVKQTYIRPTPPASSYTDYEVNDRVDAYISGAWWAGRVTRKVDPNYDIKLECDGNEVQCGFHKVRIHMDWENGKWVYNANI